MEKLKSFFSQTRNLYFSVVAMLTIVAALSTISFSYYVDESTYKEKEVSIINNIITSDDFVDGKVVVPAQEGIIVPIYVISNNNFDSFYELYYISDSANIEVVSKERVNRSIGSKDVHRIDLKFENYSLKEETVEIGIVSGFTSTDLVVTDGKKIVIE